MAIKLPKCAPSDRDVLLRLVADSFRSSDIVANSDSADLWVLFPDTDAKQAQIATDRLLSAFQTAISGRVTASVGITEFSRNSVSISAMLTEAVSALQATSAGNPVNVYEPISDLPVA